MAEASAATNRCGDPADLHSPPVAVPVAFLISLPRLVCIKRGNWYTERKSAPHPILPYRWSPDTDYLVFAGGEQMVATAWEV